MQKHKFGFVIFFLVLMLSAGMVFASSAADLYSSFSTAVDEGDIDGARKYYDDLSERIVKERESGERSLEKAFRKGNRDLYHSALSTLRTLDEYEINKEQSGKLLSLIVNEDEESQLDDACWLYQNSAFYSPRLTFSYSTSSDGYSFRYSRGISTCPGDEVELPDGSDLRMNNNILGKLSGWGIVPGEIDYMPGDVIKMPLVDQTLYAVFSSEVSFFDEKTGIDEVVMDTSNGDVISVPSVIDAPEGYYFAGWYDDSTGEYLGPEVEEYTVRGNGASFVAIYKALEIQNPSAGPYKTLLTQSQHELSFDLVSVGNEDVSNIKVTVSSENESVKFITDTAYVRDIPAGRTCHISSFRFVVDGEFESGTEIPFDVVVTDSAGSSWTGSFSFEIR